MHQLHYVFEVRFVESEARAIDAFLIDLPAIVKFLQTSVLDSSTDSDMRAKMKGWLRRLLSFKFVTTCLTQLDIDIALRIFSKQVCDVE